MPMILSSPFGDRINPVTGAVHHHNGVDLPVPVGTPVPVVAPGRVVRVYLNEAINGTGVTVQHANGWSTSYLHLSRLAVQAGQQLVKGQILGYSGGKPGSWGAGRSTGPHLHFSVRVSDRYIDPVPLYPAGTFRRLR